MKAQLGNLQGVRGLACEHLCSGEAYLQAAEADHAVHHLGDAETVAEVVEGVVLVVVMDTQLWGQSDGAELITWSYTAGQEV